MQEERLSSGPLRFNDPRREAMQEPEEVSAIVRLNELGWGAKRISRELGISRNTVKDYIAAGGWTPYQQPRRRKALDGQEGWLRERLRRHRGNADVIRQDGQPGMGPGPVARSSAGAITVASGTARDGASGAANGTPTAWVPAGLRRP
jgi:hypothetical protein